MSPGSQRPSIRAIFAQSAPRFLTGTSCLRLVALCSALWAGVPALAAQAPTSGLQPGDMVRLKVWREPELSGDFRVDERGEVVFPRIGPVLVPRLSADSLRRQLVKTYSAYLRDPSIEVTLLRRVNVQGAVRTPGLYQVDQTQTIADVLALAGGATSDGKADRVELVRGGKRIGVRLDRQTRLFDSPLQSGDQLWVAQKSWFARNSGNLVGAGITATAIIVTTFARP